MMNKNYKEKNVFEHNHTDGDFHSKIVVKKRNLFHIGKAFVNVPKWSIVVTVLLYAFLATTLISAYVVVYNARRPATFLENCYQRSCVPGFGFKCLNNTCTCPDSHYYNIKCIEKRSPNGLCTHDYQCKSGLVCKTGACQCTSDKYWNGVGCFPRSTFTETCSGDQCLTINMLFCNETTKTCQCGTNRYWDGSICVVRKTFYEFCTNTTQCGQNMVCLNNECLCNLTISWYDSINQKCITRKNELESCTKNYECLGDMKCKLGKCECTVLYQYFDTSSLTCYNQTLNNTICQTSRSCRQDLELSCQNGLCQCNTTSKFWMQTVSRCYRYLSYGESYCTDDKHCLYNLKCNLPPDIKNCTCPSLSVANMCDCPMYGGMETYWDSSQNLCIEAKIENASCLNTYECYRPMSCSWGKCTCGQFKYWRNGACYDQKSVGGSCLIHFNCRVDYGLSCVDSVCQCNKATQFWMDSAGKCKNYLSYSGLVCSADSNCLSNLFCYLNTSISQCNCPTTSAVGMCDCPNFGKNQTYWNSTSCVSRKSEFFSCGNNYECLGDMTCSSTICQCGTYQYFDVNTYKCQNQTLFNTSCSGNFSCRSDLGLSCQTNLCLCDSSTQFWLGSLGSCRDYLNYGELTCSADSDCKSSLICNLNVTENTCNCSLTSVYGMCDCPRTVANQQYWNGSSCVPAADYGEKCEADKNYTCKWSGEMICNLSGVCVCPGEAILAPGNICKSCRYGYTYFLGRCFYFYNDTTKFNWVDSLAICRNIAGGRLAILSNSSYVDYVKNTRDQNLIYWLGGSKNSTLLWMNGNTVTNICATGDLISTNDDCLAINTNGCLKSYNNECGSSNGNQNYICEYDLF